jgi:hypothetical protein
MSEPNRSRQARRWLQDLVSSALFALTGVLFLILPVAESSCGNEEILIEACLNGTGVLTGEPDVDTNDGDEFPSDILQTTELPAWLAALGIGVLLSVAGGITTTLIFDRRRQAVSRLVAALAGLVLAATTYFLAVRELHAALAFLRALFSTVVDERVFDFGVATLGIGILPTLGLFGVLCTVEVIRLLRLRAA